MHVDRALLAGRLSLRVALASGLGLLFAAHASAHCRATTCNPKLGDVCERDADGCVIGHARLFWGRSCLSFSVQRDGSPRNHVSGSELEASVRAAFDTWTSADCGGGAHPGVVVENLGKVECDQEEYSEHGANANIYVFRDDTWYDDSAIVDALGLTTAHYDPRTGQIFDVDVELNGTQGNITNSDPGDGADLLSVVTHETGHFLGLDHSSSKSAVMYSTYVPGARSLRALQPDDIAGICELYPPLAAPPSGDCRPLNGFSAVCAADQKMPSGCNFSGVGTERESAEIVGYCGLFALVLTRRKRRRSRLGGELELA